METGIHGITSQILLLDLGGAQLVKVRIQGQCLGILLDSVRNVVRSSGSVNPDSKSHTFPRPSNWPQRRYLHGLAVGSHKAADTFSLKPSPHSHHRAEVAYLRKIRDLRVSVKYKTHMWGPCLSCY